MTMTLPPVAQAPGMVPLPTARPLFIAPMFWKQSWWNNKKTVPVLLEVLQDGTIRLIGESGVVASGQACHTVASWGRSTAMVDLDLQGQALTLVCIGETVSPLHSQCMDIYLRWAEARTHQPAQHWRRGRGGITKDGDEGWMILNAWRDLLPNLGVRERVSR